MNFQLKKSWYLRLSPDLNAVFCKGHWACKVESPSPSEALKVEKGKTKATRSNRIV